MIALFTTVSDEPGPGHLSPVLDEDLGLGEAGELLDGEQLVTCLLYTSPSPRD